MGRASPPEPAPTPDVPPAGPDAGRSTPHLRLSPRRARRAARPRFNDPRAGRPPPDPRALAAGPQAEVDAHAQRRKPGVKEHVECPSGVRRSWSGAGTTAGCWATRRRLLRRRTIERHGPRPPLAQHQGPRGGDAEAERPRPATRGRGGQSPRSARRPGPGRRRRVAAPGPGRGPRAVHEARGTPRPPRGSQAQDRAAVQGRLRQVHPALPRPRGPPLGRGGARDAGGLRDAPRRRGVRRAHAEHGGGDDQADGQVARRPGPAAPGELPPPEAGDGGAAGDDQPVLLAPPGGRGHAGPLLRRPRPALARPRAAGPGDDRAADLGTGRPAVVGP